MPRELSVYIIAVYICSDAFQIKAASSDERALAGCACWAVVPSGGTLTCYMLGYVVEKLELKLNDISLTFCVQWVVLWIRQSFDAQIYSG